MILINCECGKSIAAKPEWAGINIRCAGCGRSHTLAEGTSAVETPATKACPHCAALIQPAAIKCRHCGRMVQEEPIRVTATPVPEPGPQTTPSA